MQQITRAVYVFICHNYATQRGKTTRVIAIPQNKIKLCNRYTKQPFMSFFLKY